MASREIRLAIFFALALIGAVLTQTPLPSHSVATVFWAGILLMGIAVAGLIIEFVGGDPD
jgi:hypothetical protein